MVAPDLDEASQDVLSLTCHAQRRASQRGINSRMVATALRFGRKTYQNGAIYYSIGRKEIRRYQDHFPELKHMNGVHVVLSMTGNILTVFRNQQFNIIRHC